MLRLMPHSTATTAPTQQDALAAPARDPLWLLARQWQTGEFVADDAGSSVQVQISHVSSPLLAGGPDGAPVAAIEPLVEAEPLRGLDAIDNGHLVEVASELMRRLDDAGVAAAGATLITAFPFAPSHPGPRIRPFAGRIPDPRPLWALVAPALNGGDQLPAIDGLDPAHVGGVTDACKSWLSWLNGRIAPADGGTDTPAAWDSERLEYRFGLGARLPDASVRLAADEYDGGGVEWYTFDRAGWDPAGGSGAEAAPVEVLPAPVSYPGMPRPRYWELEDGHVNLDALRNSDPAHAVLVAFAHQYANDWFVVPLHVQAGVTTIARLTVTDTFGSTTEVPAVATLDAGRGPWRLWELTSLDPDPAPGAGLRLLVPPVPRPSFGEALEDVLVVRDEMANLAWVVEHTTRDADGAPVDRYQRYLRMRPPADPAFDPAGRGDRLRYRLGTALPDYWYPLVSTTDATGRPMLTLAEVPPEASGVGDTGVRGRIVSHQPGISIADEEVPREGAHVIRQNRLLPGGSAVVVWRGRTKTPGSGEASSGLRFDVLE